MWVKWVEFLGDHKIPLQIMTRDIVNFDIHKLSKYLISYFSHINVSKRHNTNKIIAIMS